MKVIILMFWAVMLVTFFVTSCNNKDEFINTVKANNSVKCESNLSAVQKRWESAFIDICGRIEGTDVKNLINVEIPPSSMEIRIWVGYDTTPLRGIILKQDNKKWSALYLQPLKNLSAFPREPKILQSPKSGWENLWEKLEDLNILTLPDTRDIGIDNYTLDNTSVVVEIKTSNSYRIYSYFRLNEIKRDEPQKLLEICSILASEFDVELYKYYGT